MDQTRSYVGLGLALVTATVLMAVALATGFFSRPAPRLAAAPRVSAPTEVKKLSGPPYSYERLRKPDRTVVRDSGGVVAAVFTDGARSALLTGPERTFAEPSTTEAVVRTQAWVRLLPKPWKAGMEKQAWFDTWFAKALADRSPDVLQVSTQYIKGAPPVRDKKGRRVAGDASFGPVDGDALASDTVSDSRREGSDFYEYLGEPWKFKSGIRKKPDKHMYGAVDCSGYVRLVYGFRMGYPLDAFDEKDGGLPRRAIQMATFGPGVTIIPNTGRQPTDISALQPGDLLFFDGDPNDGPAVDHVGIYLGIDSKGHPRFISSRKIADGPTMGDLGGVSRIDGTGHYASTFRQAKRL